MICFQYKKRIKISKF